MEDINLKFGESNKVKPFLRYTSCSLYDGRRRTLGCHLSRFWRDVPILGPCVPRPVTNLGGTSIVPLFWWHLVEVGVHRSFLADGLGRVYVILSVVCHEVRLWQNDRMDRDATWHRGWPRPIPLPQREGGKWVEGGLTSMLEYPENGERYDVAVSMVDL